MHIHELHQRALAAVKRFFRAEAELLEVIQQIDERKGFREFGHTSLFSHAVGELKLPESTALNLINVARKAVQIPALKTEIEAGNLSVCKARKIVPVLNVRNQSEWIEKAKTLPTRKLEKEVARVAPHAAVPERMRYVTEDRIALTVALDEKTMDAIKRARDLECQRQGRPVTLEETLAALSALYLERNDPVEKAKRALVKTRREDAQNLSERSDADVQPVTRVDADPDSVPTKISNMKTGPERTDVTVTGSTRRRRWNARREPDAAHAPIVRAQNQYGPAQMSRSLNRRQSIPAATEHTITLRDGARCTALERDGSRCEHKRWLHLHHIVPVSLGGANTLQNLTTLCSAHHRMRHEKSPS